MIEYLKIVEERKINMKFLDAEFVKGFIRMANDGWEQGWHERNGGKYIFLTVLGSFVVSFCAVLCGCRIGMQASKRWKADVSWLGGVLFVILAFQKMI